MIRNTVSWLAAAVLILLVAAACHSSDSTVEKYRTQNAQCIEQEHDVDACNTKFVDACSNDPAWKKDYDAATTKCEAVRVTPATKPS